MTSSEYHRDVMAVPKHVTVYDPGFIKDNQPPANGCLDSPTMTSASLRTLLQVQRRDVVSVSGCIRRQVEMERKEQCLMSEYFYLLFIFIYLADRRMRIKKNTF